MNTKDDLMRWVATYENDIPPVLLNKLAVEYDQLRAALSEMRKALVDLYNPAKIAVNQIICMGGEQICQPCENREQLAIALYEVAAVLEKYPKDEK